MSDTLKQTLEMTIEFLSEMERKDPLGHEIICRLQDELKVIDEKENPVWNSIPDCYLFLTKDADGEIWAFDNEPSIDAGNDYWGVPKGDCKNIICPYVSEFMSKVPWKESLISRN